MDEMIRRFEESVERYHARQALWAEADRIAERYVPALCSAHDLSRKSASVCIQCRGGYHVKKNGQRYDVQSICHKGKP